MVFVYKVYKGIRLSLKINDSIYDKNRVSFLGLLQSDTYTTPRLKQKYLFSHLYIHIVHYILQYYRIVFLAITSGNRVISSKITFTKNTELHNNYNI